MKKNFIKYLACALVAVMILGTTAFAATTTTTTYDGEYITVSTQVTGATGDEQVTYLVHNSADADIADDEILYINQKPAADGVATFDYKVAMTDASLPISTAIISGSTSGAALATAGDNIDLEQVTVDNQSTTATYTVSQNWLGTEDEATLTIEGDGKYFVDGVEYTGPITVTAGGSYVITEEEKEPELPTLVHDSAVLAGEGATKSATVFATFANLPEDAEYGVELEVNGEAVFFKAYGDVNGKYAVKLVDNGTGLLAGEHSVRACYVVDGKVTGAKSN